MRSLLLVFIVGLASLASAAPPLVSPEKRQQAKEHYDAGSVKYDLGKYADAVVEFEKAYELSSNSAVLFNIAQAYRQARNYEKAIAAYRSYLIRAGNPPNRPAVEARINEMLEVLERQKKAEEAGPTGIQRDGENPQAIEKPAPEKIVVVREVVRYEPARDRLPAPRPAFRYAGIALAAVGVAGLAAGGAMSALTLSASNDVSTAAATKMQSFDAHLQGRQSDGQTFQTVSIAMYAVGGAALVAGGVLLGLGYRKVPPKVSVAPVFSSTHAGLSVGGSF